MHIGAVTMENFEFAQKILNRTAILSRNSTSGNLSKENKNTNSKRCINPYVLCIIYSGQDMETIILVSING